MRPGDLRDLVEVTRAIAAAAEARLAALRQEEAALRAKIAELDDAQRRRAASATAEDAALRAGVDLRWEGWIADRRRALTAALSRTLARIEGERLTLARDVGRREVTQTLASEVEARLRAARASRALDRG